MLSSIPALRFGDPSEFGSVVAFLCSEKAGYVDASTICLDGGKRKSTYQKASILEQLMYYFRLGQSFCRAG
jgi:hypothetical protein